MTHRSSAKCLYSLYTPCLPLFTPAMQQSHTRALISFFAAKRYAPHHLSASVLGLIGIAEHWRSFRCRTFLLPCSRSCSMELFLFSSSLRQGPPPFFVSEFVCLSVHPFYSSPRDLSYKSRAKPRARKRRGKDPEGSVTSFHRNYRVSFRTLTSGGCPGG
jgi:hypothetical protein